MAIKVIRNNYPLHSDEWYANRMNYIGASEVGAVLGLSPYTPAAKLFLEKIGMMEQPRFANKFTYWGLALEDLIADAWKYHNGEEDDYVQNKEEGKELRGCKKVNGFYVNDKYPHLSSTPDRMIDKGAFSLLDRQPLGQRCPLELKTISEFEAKTWETGIPVSYLAQVHAQMIITGTEYSELALLKSGKFFEVLPVKLSEELRDAILEKTDHFWNKLVLPGKALVKELKTLKDSDGELKEEILLELANLEPAPDGTPAYAQFLSERFNNTAESRPPTKEEYEFMLEYDKGTVIKKEGEKAMLLAKNSLLASTAEYEEVADNKCKMINRKAEGKRAYFSIKILSDDNLKTK